jgi:putative endonuclease
MPSPRQRRGAAAEDRAAEFLIAQGLRILERHVTSRFGEIDILAEDGEVIVAVEVKARRNEAFGVALEAMTDSKVEKIFAALHEVLEQRGWQEREFRLDVVAIDGNRLEYHRAFS